MVKCSPRAAAFQPNQYARPFDQNLGSPLIYFFYLHTTIRLKYMVLFHLIFLLCTTIRPKIRVHTDLFLYIFTTIRPKVRVLINLFILFVHDHLTKNQSPHLFIFFTCTRLFDLIVGSSFIYFILSLVHDHSTKNQGLH